MWWGLLFRQCAELQVVWISLNLLYFNLLLLLVLKYMYIQQISYLLFQFFLNFFALFALFFFSWGKLFLYLKNIKLESQQTNWFIKSKESLWFPRIPLLLTNLLKIPHPICILKLHTHITMSFCKYTAAATAVNSCPRNGRRKRYRTENNEQFMQN